MLKCAQEQLKSHENIIFIHKTFLDLINDESLDTYFDLVVSSLAIHHLSMNEKEDLFQYIFDHLNEEGFILNIDVVLPSSETLKSWYLLLWKEGIIENEKKEYNKISESFRHITDQYKNNPDNSPDTLEKQLDTMRKIGFRNVDCYYKYGIYAVFGGEK